MNLIFICKGHKTVTTFSCSYHLSYFFFPFLRQCLAIWPSLILNLHSSSHSLRIQVWLSSRFLLHCSPLVGQLKDGQDLAVHSGLDQCLYRAKVSIRISLNPQNLQQGRKCYIILQRKKNLRINKQENVPGTTMPLRGRLGFELQSTCQIPRLGLLIKPHGR
jgi:hypothetical protein